MDLYTQKDRFQEALGRLTEEGRYQDTFLVCQDESVRTCRLLLALAFPLLDKVLEGRHMEEEVCILLPDHTSEDINAGLNEFFTDMSSFSVRIDKQDISLNSSRAGDDLDMSSMIPVKDKDMSTTTDLDCSQFITNINANMNEEETNIEYDAVEQTTFKYDPIIHDDDAHRELSKSYVDAPENETGNETMLNTLETREALLSSTTPINEIHPKVNELEHKDEKVSGEVLTCDICSNVHSSRGNLERHKWKQHGVAMVRNCKFCEKEFKSVEELKEHKKQYYDGDNNLRCPEETCSAIFKVTNRTGFMTHIKIGKHGARPPPVVKPREQDTGDFPCEICKRKTTSQSNLDIHKMRKHGVAMLRCCNFCREEFKSIEELKEHKKRYYEGDYFKCPEEKCATLIKATNRVGFMDHLNRHWERLDFSCEDCGKVFAVKAWLTSHMLIHADPTIKPFVCNICSKSYKNKLLLRSHLQVHVNAERFKCEVCDKGYPSKGRLTLHLITHTKEKSVGCSFCERMFGRRGEAAMHEARVHTGLRKHKCSFCGMAFVDSNGLKKHVRIHTGEKPFKCANCGKGHNQRTNRKKHQDSCSITTNKGIGNANIVQNS